MSKEREKLIRHHFEAVRDPAWFESLEPTFRDYDLEAAQLKEYREAWNSHAEERDWSWWQQNTSQSNEQLRKEIKEITERVAQVTEYRKMLAEAVERLATPKDKNEGIER